MVEKKLTISVCMGTYNGEAYITEQLQTIFDQTLPADEVILCDDGSTDNTVTLIRQFIETHALENSWKLYQNSENKGYPGNFYYAMSLCRGDIVFLSDQDDVWHKCKIEKMSHIFEQEKLCNAVCCRYGLIHADGSVIHAVMENNIGKTGGNLSRIHIRDIFYKSERPGMVIAYRNNWYRTFAKENLQIPHDFLISAKAAEENSYVQLNEELAWHRRHEHNTGGEEHRVSVLLEKGRKLKEIEEYLRILSLFHSGRILTTAEGKQVLEDKYISMQDRYQALQSGKVLQVMKNACKHGKEIRIKTLICDILIVRQ